MVSFNLRVLIRREVLRFLKVPAQTVYSPFLISFLTLHTISLSLADRMKGAFVREDFIFFAGPGVFMMTVINNAFANSASSIMTSKISNDFFDVIRSPTRYWECVTAYCVGATIRCLIISVLFFLTFSLSGIRIINPLLCLLWIVLAAFFASLLGVMCGLYSQRFEDMSFITNFIITPLTLLSGTFYSIQALPVSFRSYIFFNPFFCLIEGFRSAYIDQSQQNNLFAFTYLLCLTCIFYWCCMMIFKKKFFICS